MEYGTKVKWTYTHHLNSRSETQITKHGFFIAYPVMRRGEKLAAVQFDGNKSPSYVPITEVRIIKAEDKN